ncbi:MAG: 5-Nucleotidase protein [Bacteroidota bacterium]|jgi:5'-nucleotidase|nr:5-Nucleotidase protein [Bacteroidota bacterium]
MKGYYIVVLIFGALLLNGSCRKRDRSPQANVLGTLSVDLDANRAVVRKKEALMGNMIIDAFKDDLENKGKPVDFVISNGGGMRFSETKRPNGIYGAGDFTAEMVDEMLPFGNTLAIVRMTGKQLKEVFERSLAQYPLTQGAFLQVSKELQIVIDTTQSPQVLDINNASIVSPGNRIVSIKYNSISIDSLKEYRVGTSNFIAEGNDGYVTFKTIPNELKEYIGEDQANALKEYVITKTPISPKLEGRIVFQ